MVVVLIRIFFKVILCSVLIVSVNVACPDALWAEPFSFDANSRYNKTGGGQEDQTSLNQSYRLTFDKSLSAGMLFTGNTRYAEQNREYGDDSHLYNFSSSLDLHNDLFMLNLNGDITQSQIENRPSNETYSWNANWISRLEDLPKLRLNYGQVFTQDDQSPKGSDSKSTKYGANLYYSYTPFTFLYDLRVYERENFVVNRKQESQDHLGQLQYQQSFWGQKLTVSASEQVSYYKSDLALSTELGQPLFQPLPPGALGGAFAGYDNTPANGTLTLENELLDLNYSTGVVEVLQPAEWANLGVKVNFNAVNRINVYFSDLLSNADSSQITWTAYTSNNNLTWTQIPIQSVVYVNDTIEGNLLTAVEVTLVAPGSQPLEVDYIKVVLESPGAPTIIDSAFVSELEAGRVSVGSGSTLSSSYKTVQNTGSFNIFYNPSPTWSLGYNFGHNRTDSDQGLDRSGHVQSLVANYVPPFANLSFTANLNESVNTVKDQQERNNRSLSLSMYANPLDTLDYSLGYTHSENTTDGDKEQVFDIVTFYSSAQIFPDLSSSVTVNLTNNQNLLASTETSSWDTNLTLVARISPKINLDAAYFYSHTDFDSSEAESETTIATIYKGTLSYRPSDVLLVQSTAIRFESEDETLLTGSLSWRMTPRLELSEGISIKIAEEVSSAFTTRLTWGLGRHFSFNGSSSYQIVESGKFYVVSMNLNANF